MSWRWGAHGSVVWLMGRPRGPSPIEARTAGVVDQPQAGPYSSQRKRGVKKIEKAMGLAQIGPGTGGRRGVRGVEAVPASGAVGRQARGRGGVPWGR